MLLNPGLPNQQTERAAIVSVLRSCQRLQESRRASKMHFQRPVRNTGTRGTGHRGAAPSSPCTGPSASWSPVSHLHSTDWGTAKRSPPSQWLHGACYQNSGRKIVLEGRVTSFRRTQSPAPCGPLPEMPLQLVQHLPLHGQGGTEMEGRETCQIPVDTGLRFLSEPADGILGKRQER